MKTKFEKPQKCFLTQRIQKTKAPNPTATSCWSDSNVQNPAGLTVHLFLGDVAKRDLLIALPLKAAKPMVSNSQC